MGHKQDNLHFHFTRVLIQAIHEKFIINKFFSLNQSWELDMSTACLGVSVKLLS